MVVCLSSFVIYFSIQFVGRFNFVLFSLKTKNINTRNSAASKDLGFGFDFQCRCLRCSQSRKNEMKQSQLCLKGVRAEGCGSIFPQNDEIVFSRHACENGGLLKHGFHGQGGRAGVFKGFARFENGLATRDPRAGDNILMRKSHGLDFEPTRAQLDWIVGFVGDSNVVGKAILV